MGDQIQKSKRYKYLNYVPPPLRISSKEYDLVDDAEFLARDGRIPLLIATQFGIFPLGSVFNKYPYDELLGLEEQTIGLIGKGYGSLRERPGIFEFYLDDFLYKLIRNQELFLDLRLWYDKGQLRKDGPYLDLQLMKEPSVYVQSSLGTQMEHEILKELQIKRKLEDY